MTKTTNFKKKPQGGIPSSFLVPAFLTQLFYAPALFVRPNKLAKWVVYTVKLAVKKMRYFAAVLGQAIFHKLFCAASGKQISNRKIIAARACSV